MRWLHLLRYRQTWAFAAGKFLTDPVWWFLHDGGCRQHRWRLDRRAIYEEGVERQCRAQGHNAHLRPLAVIHALRRGSPGAS